jgi:hypothetical protein
MIHGTTTLQLLLFVSQTHSVDLVPRSEICSAYSAMMATGFID